MRSLRLLPAGVAILTLAACGGTAPGWTYAPAPSPTAIPSVDPSASAAPSGSAAASASAPPSLAPSASASAAPSGSAGASASPGGTALQLAAQNLAWDQTELAAPADQPFQIVFANNDAAIPHDVDIHEGDPAGPKIHDSVAFPGVETRTLDVTPLPAGIYAFVCSVHPTTMVGSLTVE